MFTFNRDYVSNKRINYVAGEALPDDEFTQEQINRLIASGIILRVEDYNSFVESINKEVEALNPEPKRSKK